MKKPLLKALCFIVALVFMASLIAGCGTAENGTTGSESTTGTVGQTGPASQETSAPAEFSYPMDTEYVLTIFGGKAPDNFENAADTPIMQEIMKKTGVRVKFQHAAAGQEQDTFNLMIASREFPDIVSWNWSYNYPGGPEKALAEEVAIPLNDVYVKYAPNLVNYITQFPIIDKAIMTPSKKYYCFPTLREPDGPVTYGGPFLRKDWLDELGLPVPETMDEWYTVLKAFKEKKGAESPLIYEAWMINACNSFIGAYGTGRDLWVDAGGKLHYGWIETGYKDYLATMAKWYQEGLIYKDMATVDKSIVEANVVNGKSGATIGWVGGYFRNFQNALREKDSKATLVGVKEPVLKKGDKPMFGQKDFPFGGVGAVITTNCKNIEVAARFLDYGYSEEGRVTMNFGINGISYEMKDGTPTYIGLEDYTDQNVFFNKYTSIGGSTIEDKRYFYQRQTLPEQLEALTNWADNDQLSYMVPPLTIATTDADEAANLKTQIDTYQEEMLYKFIFGQESLENFDKYISQMKSLGIDRYIEIQQKAYDLIK